MYAAKVLALAKAQPKGELAKEQLWWIISYCTEGPSCKEAVEMFSRDYPGGLDNKCRSAIYGGSAFLDRSFRAMAQWSPDRQTRGQALLARARLRDTVMHDNATAEELYQEVIADFADLKLSQDSAASLGELASEDLRHLASLPPATRKGWRTGDEVCRFQAASTDGRIVQVPDSYKGKVVLLHFWATYCVPCVKEIPCLVRCPRKISFEGS